MGMFATVNANAQELKHFTLEDLNFGGNNYRNMIPKNLYCTWWGDKLVRMEKDACYLVNKTSGKETILFGKNRINKCLGNTKDIKVASLANVTFPFAEKSVVVINTGDKIYTVDFKEQSLTSEIVLGEGEEQLEYNAKSNALAYLKDNNLYVVCGSKKWQVSHDGSREIVYGQSVHRDEFGIRKGTFFSNDGTKLAFYRMDQSMVTDYPQVTIPQNDFAGNESTSCIATATPDKYPMAGETSHKVTVGVVDINTGEVVYLNAGDPTDRYFTNIAWGPDDKNIYMF